MYSADRSLKPDGDENSAVLDGRGGCASTATHSTALTLTPAELSTTGAPRLSSGNSALPGLEGVNDHVPFLVPVTDGVTAAQPPFPSTQPVTASSTPLERCASGGAMRFSAAVARDLKIPSPGLAVLRRTTSPPPPASTDQQERLSQHTPVPTDGTSGPSGHGGTHHHQPSSAASVDTLALGGANANLPSLSEASYLSLTEQSRSAEAQLSFASHSASGSAAHTTDFTRLRRRLYGAVGPPPAPPLTGASQPFDGLLPPDGGDGSGGDMSRPAELVSGTGHHTAKGMDKRLAYPYTTLPVRKSSDGSGLRGGDVDAHRASMSHPLMTPGTPAAGGATAAVKGAGSASLVSSPFASTSASASANTAAAVDAVQPPPLKGYRCTLNCIESLNGGSLSLRGVSAPQRFHHSSFPRNRSPETEATSLSPGRSNPARPSEWQDQLWRPSSVSSAGHRSGAGLYGPHARAPGRPYRSYDSAASPQQASFNSQLSQGSPQRLVRGARTPQHGSTGLSTSAWQADEDVRHHAFGPRPWRRAGMPSPQQQVALRREALYDLDVDADCHIPLVSCAHCGRRADRSDASSPCDALLMECPCELVAYCSTACQLADWPAHAPNCVAERQWVAEQYSQDARPRPYGATPVAARAQPDSGVLRECLACGLTACTLLQCRCGEAVYCTRSCQIDDWPCHRYACAAVREDTTDIHRDSLDITQSVAALLTGAFLPSQAKRLAGRLGLVSSVGTQTMPLDPSTVFPYATEAPSDEADSVLSPVRASLSSPPLGSGGGLSTASAAGGGAGGGVTHNAHGPVRSDSMWALSNPVSFGNSLTVVTQSNSAAATSPRAAGAVSAFSLSWSHAAGGHVGVAPYNYFGGRSVLLGLTAGGSGSAHTTVRVENSEKEVGSLDGTAIGKQSQPSQQRLHISTNEDLESLIPTRQPSRMGSMAVLSVRSHTSSARYAAHASNQPTPLSHHHASPKRGQQRRPLHHNQSLTSTHSRRTLQDGPGYPRSTYTSSRRGSIAGVGNGNSSLVGGGISGVSSFYGTLARYGNASFHSSTGSGSTHDDSERTSGTDTTAGTAGSGRVAGLTYSGQDGVDTRRDPQFLGGAQGRRLHANTGLTAVLITSRMLISDEERTVRVALREQFLREQSAIKIRTLIKEEAEERLAIVCEEVMWCVTVGEVEWKRWRTALFNFYYRR